MASINTPPTTPEYLTVTTPSGINIDRNRKITWGASTDAEGNLRGYIVERSSDYGQSWTQIYNGTATETADYVPIEITDVMYRVKAYDSGGLESDWRTSGNTIIPVNNAPTAPPSITVPNDVRGGGTLVISWAAASDSDNNLSGYILERSVNGASYVQVYKGDALTYTDTITKGWDTVAYRVKAYDSYNAQSSYTTSPTRTVINNSAPTISAASSLGTKSAPFAWSYTVSDVDGDNLAVTEQLDGTTTKTQRNVASGTALTFEQTNTAAGFQCLLNGDHTLQVTVSDGSLSASKTATFKKAVYKATITLAKPLTVSTPITAAALSVTGSIPSDATYKVEATNNALDASPVWQDVTAEVKNSRNILFSNAIASKGAAFNFRISVARGSSGTGGYIEAVSGAFQ